MGDSGTNTTQGSGPARRGLDIQALKRHVNEHKIDCALWAIRSCTILLSFAYFIPLFWPRKFFIASNHLATYHLGCFTFAFGCLIKTESYTFVKGRMKRSSQSAYYKALIANAATSALRLHQRLGRVQFSRQFLAEFLVEDSCHYLFYSLIFIYIPPVSPILLPVTLFAILHCASYSLTLLDTLGQNAWWGARILISLVEFQSLNILRLIAFTEIVLMPFTVVIALMGRASVLTPFIYYHFLTQRYTSRRNPYSRNMFRELRVLFETIANKSSMPGFIRQALLYVVTITSKLAPPQVAQPQQ